MLWSVPRQYHGPDAAELIRGKSKSGAGPAAKFFKIGIDDRAKAPIVAGALLHSADWIGKRVAVISERECQPRLLELRALAAPTGDRVQIGRERRCKIAVGGLGVRVSAVRGPSG